jgi:hypothetical protein
MARFNTRNSDYLNQKAAQCVVRFEYGYRFTVASPSGKEYIVELNPNLTGGRCTCPWAAEYSKHQEKVEGVCVCGHILACLNWCAGEAGRSLRAYASAEAAKRQHRPVMGQAQGVWTVSRKAVVA